MNTDSAQRVWSRELPGGGFTAIDVAATEGMLDVRTFDGALIVERRAEARRAGHTPPTVAEASGATIEWVIRELLRTGESNAAIGAALLKRRYARAYPGQA
jgi:hypothetical protein